MQPIPEEVHVWSLPVAGDGPQPGSALWQLLDAGERVRAARFRFDRHRGQFIAAHGLKRLMLSKLGAGPAPALRFEAGVHGKPELAGVPGLQFNLTHTDGLVACAVVLGQPVGLDAEPLARQVDLGVADHFFARVEADWLASLPPAERPRGFLRLWTLKECWAKAVGAGLHLPLKDIIARVDPPSIELSAILPYSAGDWHLSELTFGPTHLGALAVPAKAGQRVLQRGFSSMADLLAVA